MKKALTLLVVTFAIYILVHANLTFSFAWRLSNELFSVARMFNVFSKAKKQYSPWEKN